MDPTDPSRLVTTGAHEHERQWPQKVQPDLRETRKAPGRSPSRGAEGKAHPGENKGLRRSRQGTLKLKELRREVISNEHCKKGRRSPGCSHRAGESSNKHFRKRQMPPN